MKVSNHHVLAGVWMPILTACAGAVVLASPVIAHGQDRDRDRQDRSHDRQDRSSDRRDSGRDESRRHRDEDRVRFTHSQEGRRFENGVELRRSEPIRDNHLDRYFPHHYYSYPHYAVSRAVGSVVISPFSLYVGVFPPYIERAHVIYSRPSRVFIDVVIGGGRRDDYYLGRRGDDDRWRSDSDLKHAVYDIEDAFRNEDITLLARTTSPDTKIAIFTNGRYDYSLEPNDYLDMTRDFTRSVHTTTFEAYRVHYRAPGVYQVFARHAYRDQDGHSNTVYLCMVLEHIGGRWTLTQIDSSPDRLG